MRPFTSTISLEEARARLADAVHPIERIEKIDLADAAGRVAAHDVRAAIDVPGFARASMDGYAVVSADTAGASADSPVQLKRVERIYTGRVPERRLKAGECAEIATGAPIPDGADAVVMVEQTTANGRDISVLAAAGAGQNIVPRGADIAAGAVVLSCGDVLTAARLGSVAAIGAASVHVYGRPRVALLSTGDEVVPPGKPLEPGQIFDVNRFTLGAIVSAHGGVPHPLAGARDTIEDLDAALNRALGADIIIFSGGSSVGERDHLVDLLNARGKIIFHGIAVKPGKPTMFGKVGERPFFGMPGNPTSCLSNAHILLIPFLRATARLPPYSPHRVRAPLAKRIASPAGRHQFYTVRLVDGAAVPAFKGSGEITSLSRADGYIEIPPDQSVVDEGQEVLVTLF